MKRTITILFLFAATTVVAQQRTVSAIDADIKRYSGEIRKKTELLTAYQNDSRVSERQLALVHSRIEDREKMVALYNEQIAALERQLEANRDSLALLAKRLDKIKAEYAEMVRQTWSNRLVNNELTLLFAASDFNGAVRRNEFLMRNNIARRQRAEEITRTANGIEQGNERLTAQRETLVAKRAEQERERIKLRSDEAEGARLLQKLNSQLAATRSSVATNQRRLQELQKERERVVQQAVRATQQQQRAMAQTQTTEQRQQTVELTGRFEQNKGRLPHPVSGAIIRGYGAHGRSNARQTNIGVYFACTQGAQVVSVFDGVVKRIASGRDYGKMVIVEHGNYISAYMGLEVVSVSIGDRVKTSQQLGFISSSDNRELWQLQFFIFLPSGEEDNPANWLTR